jgi:hypothetical protein
MAIRQYLDELGNAARRVGRDTWHAAKQSRGKPLPQSIYEGARATNFEAQTSASHAKYFRDKANALIGQPEHKAAEAAAQKAERLHRQAQGTRFAGQVMGDYLSDASRNRWWLINATQALSTIAGRNALASEGFGPGAQLVGGVALTGLMELATGNIDLTNLHHAGRPAGYSTLFPKELETIDPETGEASITIDRRQSANPVAELGARYFLNRTGRILPEAQFLAERPDVTPEEYRRFVAAKRKDQFFGLEDMPVTASAPLGAIAGNLIAGKMGRNRLAGMAAGAIAGPLLKQGLIDVPTELRVIHGTAETPNDPVGEIEFLGYRLPVKAIAATVAGAAALKYGGRALKNRGKQYGQFNLNLAGLDEVSNVASHRYTIDPIRDNPPWARPPASSGFQKEASPPGYQLTLGLNGEEPRKRIVSDGKPPRYYSPAQKIYAEMMPDFQRYGEYAVRAAANAYRSFGESVDENAFELAKALNKLRNKYKAEAEASNAWDGVMGQSKDFWTGVF